MTKKQAKPKKIKKKAGKKKFIFLLVLILSILIAGAITWFLYFEKDKFRPKIYNSFEFPPKTQIFFNKNHPEIIKITDSIENELEIIKKESQRILNIEKEYPYQKNITEKAIQKLEKLKSEAKNEMEKIINQLNNIYVTANLGPSSFEENFKKNTKQTEEELNSVKKKIIEDSAPYKTDKIKQTGFIEKLKSFLNLN